MLYALKKRPNAHELNEIIEHHRNNYLDYCRVWFEDNSTAVYYNTMPVEYYKASNDIRIDFQNPILHREGAFGAMGIIRTKRVCKKILDK